MSSLREALNNFNLDSGLLQCMRKIINGESAPNCQKVKAFRTDEEVNITGLFKPEDNKILSDYKNKAINNSDVELKFTHKESAILFNIKSSLELFRTPTPQKSPEDALSIIQNDLKRYKVILTDIRMPSLTGYELAHEISKLYINHIDLDMPKIIGITAQMEVNANDKLFADFVFKPIDIEELNKKIQLLI